MRNLGLIWLALTGCSGAPVAESTSAERQEPRYRRFESELLSARTSHACTVKSDSTVWCWGQNTYHQLGDGGSSNASLPVHATLVTVPMTAVSVGSEHSCGLTTTGGVKCWGDNHYGQLGNGSNLTPPDGAPVDVSNVSNVVDLAVGTFHACVLEAGGAVKCWGRNDGYQIGDGTNTDRWSPVPIAINDMLGRPLLHDVVDLTANFQHTCSLNAEGLVFCWGNNADYSLGSGGALFPPHTGEIYPGTGAGVTAGSQFSCTVHTDGTVWCVGYDNFGQLGDGGSSDENSPVQVVTTSGPLTGVVSVAAGYQHACALARGGQVWCWGGNNFGELGNSTSGGSSNLAVQVSNISNAVAVAAGQHFSCALRVGGNIYCWGDNTWDSLGRAGGNSNIPVAVSLSGDSGIEDLAMGSKDECERHANGWLYCRGWGGEYEMGDGTTNSYGSPNRVPSLTGIVMSAGGNTVNFALHDQGTVDSWGTASYGELGHGVDSDVATTPTPIAGLTGVISIAANYSHACAVTNTGALKCWGSSSRGNIGDGTHGFTRNTPTTAAITDVYEVAVGAWHTCARSATGLYCWGRNDNGELGDDTLTQHDWPNLVSLMPSDTQQVVAGTFHTCALATGGQVYCWGDNYFGQLGDTTTFDRHRPTAASINGVVALSSYTHHTCAIKGDGSAWCWGWNDRGQLGLPLSTSYSATPVMLSLPSAALEVATNDHGTCVLMAGGTVQCFGVL